MLCIVSSHSTGWAVFYQDTGKACFAQSWTCLILSPLLSAWVGSSHRCTCPAQLPVLYEWVLWVSSLTSSPNTGWSWTAVMVGEKMTLSPEGWFVSTALQRDVCAPIWVEELCSHLLCCYPGLPLSFLSCRVTAESLPNPAMGLHGMDHVVV